eukprot:15151381-Ditylum_brightwellii.AAC.1
MKHTIAKILDRTGAHGFVWFFCMLYTVIVMDCTALESIGWRTPHEACFGVTLDISVLLQYRFYQPINFAEKESYPKTNEQLGHWLGVAENKGDTLTYWVLAENN